MAKGGTGRGLIGQDCGERGTEREMSRWDCGRERDEWMGLCKWIQGGE